MNMFFKSIFLSALVVASPLFGADVARRLPSELYLLTYPGVDLREMSEICGCEGAELPATLEGMKGLLASVRDANRTEAQVTKPPCLLQGQMQACIYLQKLLNEHTEQAEFLESFLSVPTLQALNVQTTTPMKRFPDEEGECAPGAMRSEFVYWPLGPLVSKITLEPKIITTPSGIELQYRTRFIEYKKPQEGLSVDPSYYQSTDNIAYILEPITIAEQGGIDAAMKVKLSGEDSLVKKSMEVDQDALQDPIAQKFMYNKIYLFYPHNDPALLVTGRIDRLGEDVAEHFAQTLASIQERLQAAEDPLVVACDAHMQMIDTHAYYSVNKRMARLVMCGILANAEVEVPWQVFCNEHGYLEAIYASLRYRDFSIFESYTRAVMEGHDDVGPGFVRELTQGLGCQVCGDYLPNFQRCSRCHTGRYCGRVCQVKDWGRHKREDHTES